MRERIDYRQGLDVLEKQTQSASDMRIGSFDRSVPAAFTSTKDHWNLSWAQSLYSKVADWSADPDSGSPLDRRCQS
jgi:hypothetical protein